MLRRGLYSSEAHPVVKSLMECAAVVNAIIPSLDVLDQLPETCWSCRSQFIAYENQLCRRCNAERIDFPQEKLA